MMPLLAFSTAIEFRGLAPPIGNLVKTVKIRELDIQVLTVDLPAAQAMLQLLENLQRYAALTNILFIPLGCQTEHWFDLIFRTEFTS